MDRGRPPVIRWSSTASSCPQTSSTPRVCVRVAHRIWRGYVVGWTRERSLLPLSHHQLGQKEEPVLSAGNGQWTGSRKPQAGKREAFDISQMKHQSPARMTIQPRTDMCGLDRFIHAGVSHILALDLEDTNVTNVHHHPRGGSTAATPAEGGAEDIGMRSAADRENDNLHRHLVAHNTLNPLRSSALNETSTRDSGQRERRSTTEAAPNPPAPARTATCPRGSVRAPGVEVSRTYSTGGEALHH